jgi:hypothetical protein
MEKQDNEKRYSLHYGIHHGTIISRDSGNPIQHNTIDDAIRDYRRRMNEHYLSGCFIWFVKIIDNQTGDIVWSEPGEPYQRRRFDINYTDETYNEEV